MPNSKLEARKSPAVELEVNVLRLDAYVAIKEALDGEKDRAMLPVFRGTLEQKQNLENGT